MSMSFLNKVLIGVGVAIGFVALVMLAATAYFARLFKDGLGPDAVESTGAVSHTRFLEGFIPVLPWALGLFVVGLFLVLVGVTRARKLLRAMAQPGVQADLA